MSIDLMSAPADSLRVASDVLAPLTQARDKRFCLPQEIVDYIIDYVQDSKALRTCSLLCKSWLPRSSRHLLRHVAVLDDSLPDFARDLSRLATCVVRLDIKLTEKPAATTDLPLTEVTPFHLLHQLIPSLLHLSDLRINLLSGIWPPTPSLPKMQRSLSVLEVQGCPPAGLQRLLGFFEMVDYLRIRDGGFHSDAFVQDSTPELDRPIGSMPKHIVQKVRLNVNYSPIMLKALREMLDITRLSNLAIRRRASVKLVAGSEVNMMLELIGQSIKQFEYRHSHYIKPFEGERLVAFSCESGLTEVFYRRFARTDIM